MTWRVGDVALVQLWGPGRDSCRFEGEFCILRERTSKNPSVWLIQLADPMMLDQVLVSEHTLQKPAHPNTKTSWADGPWQPTEYMTRFP